MLPLKAFMALRTAIDQIVLSWSEEDPGGLKSIQIERSGDGAVFEQIGECRQPVNFNYTYADEGADGRELHYRLKLLHKKGETTYSSVSRVEALPPIKSRVCHPPLLF